jgi:hypothetical protein
VGYVFVVVAASLGGGGTAMGPHDIFPDGWCVQARRLLPNRQIDPESPLYEFYQSGSFINKMLAAIPVVGHLDWKMPTSTGFASRKTS